jgi:hypothetical protein
VTIVLDEMLKRCPKRQLGTLLMVVGAVFSFLLGGCGGGSSPDSGSLIYGLNTANTLLEFHSGSPGTIDQKLTVTGLIDSGETLLGMDFRLSDSKLYAVSSSNRLYTINLTTGAATLIGATPFSVSLTGSIVGFNFDPVTNQIRMVTSTGENLRLNADDGTVISKDTKLAYYSEDINASATPAIGTIGYISNSVGTTTTSVYGIDYQKGTLVTIGGIAEAPSPNDGTVFTRGSLGTTPVTPMGFDISGSTRVAYLASAKSSGDSYSLYSVNLATGVATSLGTIDSSLPIRAIAAE